MKKQVFHFILGVFFMLAIFPTTAWSTITNSGFEDGETGWTKAMQCPSTTYPGVSIQNSTTTLPAHTGSRSAVFYGQIPVGSGCIETDASLTQSVTIDTADIVTLKYYYRIKRRVLASSALASAEFKVRIGSDDVYSKIQVSDSTGDSGWIESPPIDISDYKGTTANLLFIFSTTDNVAGHELFWMIDDISITYGTAGPTPGNINGDAENKVDLADAILSLQILAGIDLSGTTIVKANDVDGNDTNGYVIGLENPIYILQDVAGLRPE